MVWHKATKRGRSTIIADTNVDDDDDKNKNRIRLNQGDTLVKRKKKKKQNRTLPEEYAPNNNYICALTSL